MDKITKLENSFIIKTYKSEIDTLLKIYQHIDANKDELIIHKKIFKVLPKLKYLRRKEKQIIITDEVIARIKITIPFTIKEEIIIKDATKFHNDYIECVVKKKIYKPEIKEFINENLERIKKLLNI